ncbi:3-hydroxyacyl-ACP dehydratase FabZ family protein [Calycomorphotria hydatis]|uniref:3-hydroxyacyl-[acyl-carrier-protein] dehydratase FabZ n=1 Tax=Calycomorphotria hydatis TaxID=2528027 RepID=A0A517T5I3_9PLAN|nr:3-hydroxyacyl-ACP dehydratase FabZ family protein [Calycomorphotria hydatis]QDT63643.1 3-hydroxyacyl-[acyl-carrier-protein] dehydratase FabZ [Calycomorphotria hydatis]
MKFQLVDRITELTPGESITGEKLLTSAEEYLADHFPGFAVMPGVLMIETLVQTSAWLLRATDDFKDSTILLKEARATKFNSFVQPGHKLIVNCQLQKREEGVAIFKCTSQVSGESAVSSRLHVTHFNLRDKNPELAEQDEKRIKQLRAEFNQLWKPHVNGTKVVETAQTVESV